MFGHTGYLHLRDDHPRRKVSEPEFIKLCLENGMTEKEAKLQAKWAKGLGSEVKLGEEIIGIDAD